MDFFSRSSCASCLLVIAGFAFNRERPERRRLFRRQGDALKGNVVAAVFFDALGKIMFGHTQPGWVPISDIECDQRPIVIAPVRYVPHYGRTGESMKDPKADSKAA